ncbi:hypothetical protein OJAV_G00107790 [Oryzias javanicus]|uniref:Nuclear pore complex protein Nup153 n=1 Tax=Oryzias javanicus TaxID=123683 RepID=A0A3S2P4J8_ORYJA|nr:hypothetical protein OJAV_G00107790 [Oryzias javanicus]
MTAIRRRNTDRHSDERTMAATGGGKIRSRRYHIASKPYAKSKQQTGLISRVTDTVKSIVPSWLQKYFKNGDSSEGGESLESSDQNCQLPPAPPNSSEEAPPPLDGRNSPEPSTSTTEPSTSRASLNFQDYVLSRPPLSRTHLHLTPLDTSSPTFGGSSNLFSQPSTSSAPGPFSTGFSLVKEIKDNLSQHEDDNISTTSGFSSRASDKVFGTSSNSTLSSTVLNSSQLGDSPFYPGKTTYGGAAAVRSSRSRPGTPYQAPVRRQIKAKPAGAQPCGVNSATARRILLSLEQMSSPLADARRIPAASSNLSPSMDGMKMDMSNNQAKRKRMDLALPPVQKLVVPATTSVSGNRSVSFRPTLTPGGFRTLSRSTREKTPTRQSPQLPEESPGPSQSTRSLSGPVYPLSSTPAPSSMSSGGGKMKRERTTARPSKRTEDDDVTEEPKLPAISLPIAASSLPTFTFSTPLPPPTTTSTSVTSSPEIIEVTPAKEMATNKDPPKALTPPCVPFTFSSPIVKATAASPPSYSSSPGFTFSAPVAKLGPSMSNGNLSAPITAAVKPVTSNKTEDFDGPFKPAKTLKQGSVLDLLKSPAFASSVASVSPSTITTSQLESPQSTASPSTTTTASSSSSSSTGFSNLFKAPEGWSCDVCLVQNKQSDSKCVCCSAPKPNLSSKPTDSNPSPAASVGVENSSTSAASSTTTTTGFGTMFSKPAGTWDCDTCLVVNKPDAVKCVACETAKPGTGLKPSLTFPSAFTTVKTPPASTASVSTCASGLGDKFKKPEGAWECDTCLVQNKAEDVKCVACTAAKPGASAGPSSSSSASSAPLFGLADKFKQPEGSWECDVCCVQNKAADVKCVACQAVKPGSNVEANAFGSSMGTFSGATSGSSTSGSSTFGGFKFGTSDSASGSASASFKFGTLPSSTSSPSGGFKFGVQLGNSSSETSSKEAAASSGFKFGSSSGGFKFGTSSSDDKKSDQPASEPAFKFGVGSGAVFGSSAASTEGGAPKGGFTFGLSKPKDETSESASATPLSSSQDKVNIPASSNHTSTETVTTTSATTTKKPSVFERLGESNLATNTSKTPPTFGSLQAGKEPAAPTFAFGKPEEKKEPNASAAPPNFVFGGASKEKETPAATAPSGGFSFGKSGGSTEQPPPPYSFGKSAEKSENTTSEAPKPTFNFGQSAADSAAPPQKQAFSFIASNPDSTTSSTPTPAPSLFSAAAGNSTSTTSVPSAPPSTFLFGQPSTTTTSDAAPAKPFVFGNSQEQPAASLGAPVNSAQAQPFIFGAAANPAAPPAVSASSFGFGTTAPSAASTSAPSAAPSPFAFSSAPSSGFGENQTPSFGSTFGSPFPATPSQAPAFGAKPNAAPVFAQQTNSTSVFGTSVNAAPSGGFQFGGASAFGSTNNSTPGVFTFGAGAAASPAPPANTSIAPQPGATGGGFNFSQPPAFNIGVAKFSSPSPAVTPAIAGRKIKTAVRRRK